MFWDQIGCGMAFMTMAYDFLLSFTIDYHQPTRYHKQLSSLIFKYYYVSVPVTLRVCSKQPKRKGNVKALMYPLWLLLWLYNNKIIFAKCLVVVVWWWCVVSREIPSKFLRLSQNMANLTPKKLNVGVCQ